MMKRLLTGLAITVLAAPTLVMAQEQRSADELAREMSNPTAAVSALTNSFDFTTYAGDLPGASDQTGWSYLLQPAIPFPLEGGANILFRPAIPILLDTPIYHEVGIDGAGFDGSGVKFGDIAFDLAYGKTTANGILILGGLTGSFPTGGEGVTSNEVSLGPEVVLGVLRQWGLVGFLATQRWGISGDKDVNTMAITAFYAISMGGGWQFVGSPIATYNPDAEANNKWAIPLAAGFSRTTLAGSTPLKLTLQVWKYIEKPEAFATDWQVRLSIAPVIKLPWG